MGAYNGRGGTSAGGNNMMLVAILGVVLLLVSSSALGLVGYFQGWFGGLGTASTPVVDPTIDPLTGLPYATAATAVTDPTAAASAGGFSGLSTQCALSYIPNQDKYNSAVPPFDPSRCQGVQMEANCQSWLSVQQGTQWKWQKTGILDGCVPVSPDVTLSPSSAPVYGTDAGAVVVTSAPGGININQSGGDAQAQAGGYGKGSRWRNVNDSKKIITAARKGVLPKAKVPLKTTAKRAVVQPVKKARAGPTPYSSPAYSEGAPYSEGLISYSML